MEFGIQWISWLPGPALWSDFSGYYLAELTLLSQGYLLYRDIVYSTTPLFLYSMLPFYDLGGSKAAMIPIVLADALTAPVIYLIVRKVSSEKVALVAGLGYAFSPVALVNEGYLWLASQPVTLFIVLSILLLKKGRPVLGAGALAIAVLFNQEALFILPVFAIYIIKSRTSLLKPGGLFALTLFGVLSPFLILAPKVTLSDLSFFPFLGPVEPSRLPTVTPSNMPTVTPSNMVSISQSCRQTLVPHVYTGAFCGGIPNFKLYAWYLQLIGIDKMVAFIAPFLFVLFAAGLIAVRRSPNILEMACAYSMMGGLFIFSALVHTPLAYYFVPVYALILASVTSGRTLIVGLAATTLGFLAGEGIFQLIIPIACIFAFTMMQDASLRASATSRGYPVAP